MKIFIGGAWPYANGSLHLGHIASLLPGDVLARYHRIKGDEVLYVSGSDCHGTPIALRAKSEGVNPKEITDRYHEEFYKCFSALGFSYDIYSRTDCEFHHEKVKEILRKLYNNELIYEKVETQHFCNSCNQFLADRYIEGRCPNCGNIARGDQCDYCSELLNSLELKDVKCKLCGSEPSIKETRHLYFELSRFQDTLSNYVSNSHEWRDNAIGLAKRYVKEGLRDRAVTRDLELGVEVPIEGYGDKKIYVWIEAVCGYITAAMKWAEENNKDWEEYWKSEELRSYFIHGKDNIPFHTIILQGILLGLDEGYRLPDRIVSSEYLTIESKKLSTSRNWAIWVPYMVENYHPDSLRYFLLINGPERRDADFSWREFINRHNGELLGAYGNFVNRTLVFIKKSFDSKVPEGKIDKGIEKDLKTLYSFVGAKIENGEFKIALEEIFEFIRKSNKYFDIEEPWKTLKENKEKCENTLYNCIQIIANLSNLLESFVPKSCESIRRFLNIEEAVWKYISLEAGSNINDPEIIFNRIDKKVVTEEKKKLG